MSQPTGFARYYLIDDYGTGGSSGEQLSPDFQAATPADAATIAQGFATMFNRPVRLVQAGGAPPWTPLYSPSTCRVLPSAIPASITF